MIHSRPMRDLDQIAHPGHAERARTPHGIVSAELRGGRALGRLRPHTVRHSAGLSAFRCAMLAFVRDSFMTSHASPGPVPVNVLGLDNGLVQSSFRAPCIGSPHTVRHGAGVMRSSMCYARVRSRSVHDQPCLARPGPCGPARHGQRARDAPSVSTSSAILCLQRSKGRFGGVSLYLFATRVRTHLIFPTRTP